MEFLLTLSLISEDLDRLGDATQMSSDSLQSSTQQRTLAIGSGSRLLTCYFVLVLENGEFVTTRLSFRCLDQQVGYGGCGFVWW